MAIKSEAIIYKIIEKHIKASKDPLSCSDLWDNLDVRENAKSPEKVSDYLGLMWRRGLIQRWQTPLTSVSKSRYAYSWKTEETTEFKIEAPAPTPRLVSSNYKKSNVTITEDGPRLILDFDYFTMTIQSKG